jgi:hypothetical protein
MTYGSASYSDGTKPTAPADGSSGFSDPKVAEGIAAMKEAGYKVTPTGVTLPDGTSVPASAFNSAASMTAAGFDPAAAREAQKVSDALNDEISKYSKGRVASVGVDSGGGGGAAGSGSGSSGEGSDMLTLRPMANPFALGLDAKKKLIAGKTVMFEGEPIGVRGQDIFEMVHTAYQRKRAGHNFIEADDGGTTVRAPASVVKFKGR